MSRVAEVTTSCIFYGFLRLVYTYVWRQFGKITVNFSILLFALLVRFPVHLSSGLKIFTAEFPADIQPHDGTMYVISGALSRYRPRAGSLPHHRNVMNRQVFAIGRTGNYRAIRQDLCGHHRALLSALHTRIEFELIYRIRCKSSETFGFENFSFIQAYIGLI